MPPTNNNNNSNLLQIGFILFLLLALFPNFFIGVLKTSVTAPLSVCHQLLSPPPPPPTEPAAEAIAAMSSSWAQKSLTLPSRARGSYLITDHVLSELPEIRNYKTGLLNLFVQHTSCALSLNENWDEDVREDMSDALDRIAPEDRKGNLYRHSAEGLDDMPVRIPFYIL